MSALWTTPTKSRRDSRPPNVHTILHPRPPRTSAADANLTGGPSGRMRGGHTPNRRHRSLLVAVMFRLRLEHSPVQIEMLSVSATGTGPRGQGTRPVVAAASEKVSDLEEALSVDRLPGIARVALDRGIVRVAGGLLYGNRDIDVDLGVRGDLDGPPDGISLT
jgi:hypothetical protein